MYWWVVEAFELETGPSQFYLLGAILHWGGIKTSI